MTAPAARRVRLIGVGPGDPEQVTLEAVSALQSVAFFVVTDKGGEAGQDPLALLRLRLLERHLPGRATVVSVPDPDRERRPERTATLAEYRAAVARWHAARAEAVEQALLAHDGDAGFLVWGDPGFYDSTLRVLETVRERGRVRIEIDVIPGVSSIQVLAARHRVVLHEVGGPIHITTQRRLREAVAAGQRNLVVMLNRELRLDGLDDWWIWWGANLGTAHEALVSGRVGEVAHQVHSERRRVAASAGWVMDLFLLRGTERRGPAMEAR